jgi:hypothetical protein
MEKSIAKTLGRLCGRINAIPTVARGVGLLGSKVDWRSYLENGTKYYDELL